jgi:hypothetical protein
MQTEEALAELMKNFRRTIIRFQQGKFEEFFD